MRLPLGFFLTSLTLFLACSSEKNTGDPPPTADGGQADAADGSLPDAADDDRTDAADPLATEVAQRFADAAAAGFSGSALVIVGGRQILAAGYGMADRQKGTPNGVETAFDFGSVLKDFTAAAIFQLAGEGKLTTSAPLSTLFDDVPADKATITVLQILQHRAGLAEYHDTEGDFEAMTRLEARARIFAEPLLFDPGEDEAYSNSGYTLLADIVETVSGQPFTDYVREHLFAPANLQASGFFGDPLFQQVDTAIGYEASTFGANDPAGWPYTWALIGNGGLVSTVGDLDRWATAMWTGRVLAPAAFDAYRSNYLESAKGELEGATVYAAAGGGDYGLGGLVLDCPEKSTRIVIGTNTHDSFDIETFGLELGRFVLSAR